MIRNPLTTGTPPAANTPSEISALLIELDRTRQQIEAVAELATAADMEDFHNLAVTNLARIQRWRGIALARLESSLRSRREAIIATLPTEVAA